VTWYTGKNNGLSIDPRVIAVIIVGCHDDDGVVTVRSFSATRRHHPSLKTKVFGPSHPHEDPGTQTKCQGDQKGHQGQPTAVPHQIGRRKTLVSSSRGMIGPCHGPGLSLSLSRRRQWLMCCSCHRRTARCAGNCKYWPTGAATEWSDQV
jgi:hypothetical protein